MIAALEKGGHNNVGHCVSGVSQIAIYLRQTHSVCFYFFSTRLAPLFASRSAVSLPVFPECAFWCRIVNLRFFEIDIMRSQRSRFSTGWRFAVRQPFLCHFLCHGSRPFSPTRPLMTYLLSLTISNGR